MSDTVVFIPAWNEEDNLPAVLDDLRAELPEVDVLVVDDGSTDDPWPPSSRRRHPRSTRWSVSAPTSGWSGAGSCPG